MTGWRSPKTIRREARRKREESELERWESELARLAGLSMSERIEEAKTIDDIKVILNMFREHLNLH